MANVLRAGFFVAVGLGVALLAAPVQAQEGAPIKFGKPDPKDFDAKNFVGDSAASAVVLCDYGITRFRLNGTRFQLESDRVTRIKVLKKSGYDVATVEVPLYHRNSNEEKLTSLRGFTYNPGPDGQPQKTKLETSGVFTEERTPNVRVRKFTLPAVREGSVIEYAYTVTSDYLFNFQDWTFQREIPVRWSEFRAYIPEYFDYKMLFQGYHPLAVQTRDESTGQFNLHIDSRIEAGMGGGRQSAVNEVITGRVTNYHWAMKDVPALRPEPFMTTPEDYVARIDFELAGEKMPGDVYRNVAGTWEKINEELMASDEFGGLLDRGGFLKEPMLALKAKHANEAERAAAVRAFVMQAVKYDGTNRYSASGSLKKTYDAHRGTSADVNLLLIAALRQAGLQAQPVLLSTRAHGRVDQNFPLLEKFNYVVGLVGLAGDKTLFVDATEPLLPCGALPQRCLSQIGRVVSKDPAQARWVELAPAHRYVRYQEAKLTLDAQGNLTGKVRDEHGGYAAQDAREKLLKLGEKKYVSELVREHPGWELPVYKFAAQAEPEQPLRLDYDLRHPAADEKTVRELYISPLASFADNENPFRHETRNYPVDFGMPQEETIMVTLTLPAGYAAELPKPTAVALPDNGGRFTYSASSPTPGTVQLLSRLTLAKPVYAAEEYAHLREFYRLALAKQSEKLVVKKI